MPTLKQEYSCKEFYALVINFITERGYKRKVESFTEDGVHILLKEYSYQDKKYYVVASFRYFAFQACFYNLSYSEQEWQKKVAGL